MESLEIKKVMPMISFNIKAKKVKVEKRVRDFTSLPKEVQSVIEIISKDTGVLVFDILRQTRKEEIVKARHLAMYMIKTHMNYSLKEVGSFFSGRDHSTVINAIQSVNNQVDTDKKYSLLFNKINTMVSNELYIQRICSQIPAKIF